MKGECVTYVTIVLRSKHVCCITFFTNTISVANIKGENAINPYI